MNKEYYSPEKLAEARDLIKIHAYAEERLKEASIDSLEAYDANPEKYGNDRASVEKRVAAMDKIKKKREEMLLAGFEEHYRIGRIAEAMFHDAIMEGLLDLPEGSANHTSDWDDEHGHVDELIEFQIEGAKDPLFLAVDISTARADIMLEKNEFLENQVKRGQFDDIEDTYDKGPLKGKDAPPRILLLIKAEVIMANCAQWMEKGIESLESLPLWKELAEQMRTSKNRLIALAKENGNEHIAAAYEKLPL